ncbi:MAG TPA: hypothetical protein VHM48_10490 [Candidatus Limnocylindrales bacterium]|nr:hypothetical protein [Candidatus Limnocylindrales bacterium]
MPFPFLPGGVIVAATVLIGALTAFGLVLRAMDRAVLGLRDMAVSSLVSGLRGWSNGRQASAGMESPRSTTSPWSVASRPESVPAPRAAPAGRPETFDPPEMIDLGSRPIEEPVRRRR